MEYCRPSGFSQRDDAAAWMIRIYLDGHWYGQPGND